MKAHALFEALILIALTVGISIFAANVAISTVQNHQGHFPAPNSLSPQSPSLGNTAESSACPEGESLFYVGPATVPSCEPNITSAMWDFLSILAQRVERFPGFVAAENGSNYNLTVSNYVSFPRISNGTVSATTDYDFIHYANYFLFVCGAYHRHELNELVVLVPIRVSLAQENNVSAFSYNMNGMKIQSIPEYSLNKFECTAAAGNIIPTI